ncbi:MAG: hypothetical protein R3E79_49795 [Caldilineaceae bacterium]
MNTLTRYARPTVPTLMPPIQQADEPDTPVQSAEIDRLLTAAVVNRRFCRLLLSNPIAALTLGYRGESFRLNPEEVSRVSAIRATSLRDFAAQLLMNGATTADIESSHERRQQAILVA